ncbi:hypothetical protein SLEP1_g9385 [Rubroshorea leprosula]|uniref:Uncharacterized protein n=1 Tax=Rubroshorea leprosula TaxID=152421 RepID=A0AAV5I996_9ROSI|nr:hypothetical protein SLEP1_g9385 [Rubroshorea leprosula]
MEPLGGGKIGDCWTPEAENGLSLKLEGTGFPTVVAGSLGTGTVPLAMEIGYSPGTTIHSL